jgi:hypothetical protein
MWHRPAGDAKSWASRSAIPGLDRGNRGGSRSHVWAPSAAPEMERPRASPAICSRRQPNRSSTQCRGERGSRPSSYRSQAVNIPRQRLSSTPTIVLWSGPCAGETRMASTLSGRSRQTETAVAGDDRRQRSASKWSSSGRATRWEFSLRSSALRKKPIWLACHHWSETTRYGPVQPDQGHDTGYPSAETGDQRETTHRHGRYSRRKASRGSRRAARRAGR